MTVETIGLLCAVIVLVAVVGLLVRRRLRLRTAVDRPVEPRGLGGGTERAEDQLAEPGVDLDEVVLVALPNRRDEGLVLGSSEAVSIFERSGLAERSSPTAAGPLPQIIRQVMTLGASRINQGAKGEIDSGRIVKLSAETVEQLRRHGPALDKAGKMLGVVRGAKGRMTHVMRLDAGAAKAIVASNAATLALTAALSAQLQHIEQQLTEIRETLDGLVRDNDRRRLARAAGTNQILQSVAESVRRRGEITEADWGRLAAIDLPVATAVLETEYRFAEMSSSLATSGSRADRVKALERLLGPERLEYWLAVRIEAELAKARSELLQLYWEQSRHPESARQLAEEVSRSIAARRERLAHLGSMLRALADPEARTRLDPIRLVSRHRLKRDQRIIDRVLGQHDGVFAPVEDDSFAIVPMEDDRARE